jgi:hypothetical protein
MVCLWGGNITTLPRKFPSISPSEPVLPQQEHLGSSVSACRLSLSPSVARGYQMKVLLDGVPVGWRSYNITTKNA